jgi:hypothetical protein
VNEKRDPLAGAMRALGVSDETLTELRAAEAQAREATSPTEDDVAQAVSSVALEVADDRMIPLPFERLNGVVVPRWSQRNADGSYTLAASRVKRATVDLVLSPEDARAARARYLLWHGYYVRVWDTRVLSYTERDAARRLYWDGRDPPPEPRTWLASNRVSAELRRASEGNR